MGAGWRERGWGIFNSWPPLSSPVKHTSFSSSKNKNIDPYPWHEGEIDVPNQSRGSWNLFFNALFCFNIVQYSRVTATNTFISQTQFCGFSPLFFIRYRYHQIFLYPGKKTLTGLQRMYSTQEDAKYDLKVSFLTLFRNRGQYGNILAESICMLLTKKGFFCSRSSERILILVFLWCKATNFRLPDFPCP